MTSLFGNYAIKQSLGVTGVTGRLMLDDVETRSVSLVPQPKEETSLAGKNKRPVGSSHRSMEERLFDARATSKILASQVAMYMQEEWRRKLYRQLDSLLDVDEWTEGDAPLAGDSFATFLRLMLLVRPSKKPGFGSTSAGNLLAVWSHGDARITIECRPDDHVRFVASHQINGERETGAIDTTIDRVPEHSRNFGLERLYAFGPN